MEGGRARTWRVTYEDGSAVDATFAFIQNREAGVWVITSDAFPTHDKYRTVPFTSEDVLSW